LIIRVNKKDPAEARLGGKIIGGGYEKEFVQCTKTEEILKAGWAPVKAPLPMASGGVHG
jgi:ribulose 1,5-bisphosphate carboxylase large subunit-like protein